eukprot:TRINITY_DN19867_c0_g1_i1.p1 TRINITY_DN19867_c0_g1~~TRINITY_DN19867_c0_g1_i1.p1  ORF type:complete len:499 (+),score=146.74 TRINITY_DN19867_c0_g1_i1:60-1499(+)
MCIRDRYMGRNAEKGCNTKLFLKGLRDHEKNACEFAKVSCMFRPFGCRFKASKEEARNLVSHERKCEFGTRFCPFCLENYRLNGEDANHLEECGQQMWEDNQRLNVENGLLRERIEEQGRRLKEADKKNRELRVVKVDLEREKEMNRRIRFQLADEERKGKEEINKRLLQERECERIKRLLNIKEEDYNVLKDEYAEKWLSHYEELENERKRVRLARLQGRRNEIELNRERVINENYQVLLQVGTRRVKEYIGNAIHGIDESKKKRRKAPVIALMKGVTRDLRDLLDRLSSSDDEAPKRTVRLLRRGKGNGLKRKRKLFGLRREFFIRRKKNELESEIPEESIRVSSCPEDDEEEKTPEAENSEQENDWDDYNMDHNNLFAEVEALLKLSKEKSESRLEDKKQIEKTKADLASMRVMKSVSKERTEWDDEFPADFEPEQGRFRIINKNQQKSPFQHFLNQIHSDSDRELFEEYPSDFEE